MPELKSVDFCRSLCHYRSLISLFHDRSSLLFVLKRMLHTHCQLILIYVFFLTSSFTFLSFFLSRMCILSRIASLRFFARHSHAIFDCSPFHLDRASIARDRSRDSLGRMYAANAKYNYNYNITVTMIVLYYLVSVRVAVLRT